MELSETHSGEEAARHQHSIEHEGRCVASHGTLGQTTVDRQRLWRAIAKYGTSARGWLELGAPSNRRQLDELAKAMPGWVRKGRVKPASAKRWRTAARRHLDTTPQARPEGECRCRVWTRDRADHAEMCAWVIARLVTGNCPECPPAKRQGARAARGGRAASNHNPAPSRA